MRGERALLGIGESLVGRACRRLPREIRDDRYREWAAELPAILHDPEIGLAPYRAVRMLGYAADTLRGTALTPGRAQRRPAAPPLILGGLLFIAGVAVVAWSLWDTVRAPGHWVSYVQLASSFLLLVVLPISRYVRSTVRMTGLITISGCLAVVAVYAWNAVQAPGDWVNYLVAVWFFLLPAHLAWLLIRRWGRVSGRNPGTLAR